MLTKAADKEEEAIRLPRKSQKGKHSESRRPLRDTVTTELKIPGTTT